jgi:hypothetical protein
MFSSVNPLVPTQSTLLDEWKNLSSDCQKGLQTALPGKDTSADEIGWVKAVNRALAQEGTLETATSGTDIDWTMLAAIGIRESGWENTNQSGGAAVGVFQIDLGKNPDVTAQQATNMAWEANWAANYLNNNMEALASAFPSLSPDQLLQATAASYNFGIGNISGNPAAIDVGTTHNNYGSNILQLMDCFR